MSASSGLDSHLDAGRAASGRGACGGAVARTGDLDDPAVMDLEQLAASQHGLVARRQLQPLGIDADRIRNQVQARRWAHRSSRVVSTFTGRLDARQRRWLGVLHAGPGAMVGALTAASDHGLRGWDRDLVTIWVSDPLHDEPIEGVRFFRTRRPLAMLQGSGDLPTTRLEPALLLWGAYEAPWRHAFGALAAAVQQGCTTPERLGQWVDQLRPLRRAAHFRAALAEIAGGVRSVSEADVARMCRLGGLQPPRRQTPRLDTAGEQRYTDCEWDLPDGSTLVLEVEGTFHMDVRHWAADKKRQRRLTTRGRHVVSCTSWELRHEPEQLAQDLARLGVPTLPGRGVGRGASRGPDRAA